MHSLARAHISIVVLWPEKRNASAYVKALDACTYQRTRRRRDARSLRTVSLLWRLDGAGSGNWAFTVGNEPAQSCFFQEYDQESDDGII